MHTDLFSMALADGPDMLPPPPRAPSSEMGDLKLYFTKIDVHRVDHAKDGAKDYIVSNLKTFDVGVLLHNERTQQLAYSVPLGLQVTVMLESGEPVGQPQALAGDTLKAVDSGRCNFRLTINALSEHHGKAKFVLKIEPADPTLRRFPNLSLISTPLRSVTKLRPSGHSTSPPKQQAATPGSSAATKGTKARATTPTTEATVNTSGKRPLGLRGGAATADPPIESQSKEQLLAQVSSMRGKIQQLEADNMEALRKLAEVRREKERKVKVDEPLPLLKQEEEDDLFATVLQGF